MITDLADLEPVLAQYDTGKVLIGPMLNLSINSSFRFFYVAGKANKIYQSLALGFIETESDAQRQRADIVAQIQSRFGELKILDTQLELAREAHALWPNEETARFLATASSEAKLPPAAAAAPQDCLETDLDVAERPRDSGLEDGPLRESLIEAIDLAFKQAVSPGVEQTPTLDSTPTPTPAKLPDAYATWPLSGEPPQPQQRHAALKHDDIALAVLGLKSSSQPVGNAEPSLDTATLFDIADTETIATPPIPETGRSARMAPVLYRFFALAGAPALVAGLIFFASARQTAKDHLSGSVAAQLGSTALTGELPQTTATVTAMPARQTPNLKADVPSPPTAVPAPPSKGSSQASNVQPAASPDPSRIRHAAPADERASVAKPAPETSLAAISQSTTTAEEPRTSSLARAQNADPPVPETKKSRTAPTAAPAIDALAASTPEVPSATAAKSVPAGAVAPPPVARVDARVPPSGAKPQARVNPISAEEIASLLGRSRDFLKTGDFAAARVLLRRAAESGSADAALMLGKTFDPAFLNEVGAIGIQPDMEQARQWYQKAAELGSEAAAQRLANLTQPAR
jgi:hypothetical protein